MSEIVSNAAGQRRWFTAFLPFALRKKYTPAAIAVATGLFEIWFNRTKSGQCNPGYDKIIAALGINERTLFRAIKVLETDGWLTRTKPGQHENVQFTFLIPPSEVTTVVTSGSTEQPVTDAAVTSSGTGSEVTASTSRGDKFERQRCHYAVTHNEHLNTGTQRSAPPARASEFVTPSGDSQLVARSSRITSCGTLAESAPVGASAKNNQSITLNSTDPFAKLNARLADDEIPW
ncbi:hypothetical protein [Bradyrhizobium sp. SZCCHNRI20481]|uniref:hypothetical protein n=1 Tax=Bradyrhizobium sp. SZCCHNRI20481 TaxID=3057286 RepID=UPI002915E8AB|nr:hypothetical protein [Bradyrhizobium sp. SZCCHNRI20481]